MSNLTIKFLTDLRRASTAGILTKILDQVKNKALSFDLREILEAIRFRRQSITARR